MLDLPPQCAGERAFSHVKAFLSGCALMKPEYATCTLTWHLHTGKHRRHVVVIQTGLLTGK